jgi:hypothetical protein
MGFRAGISTVGKMKKPTFEAKLLIFRADALESSRDGHEIVPWPGGGQA